MSESQPSSVQNQSQRLCEEHRHLAAVVRVGRAVLERRGGAPADAAAVV